MTNRASVATIFAWLGLVLGGAVGLGGLLIMVAAIFLIIRSSLGPASADPHGYGVALSIPFGFIGLLALLIGGGIAWGCLWRLRASRRR